MEEDLNGGIADAPDNAPAEEGGIADEGAAPAAEAEAPAETAGDQKQEEKPAEPEYELEAGEGFPMPEENLRSFSATCRKAGLSKEQAEAVLGWHRDQYRGYASDMDAQKKQVLDGWSREIAGDKEFGGAQWKSTLADARRVLAVADEDGSLRQLLRESSYQHNPTVIRAIARLGRMMREDTLAKAGGEGTSDKPLWDRMYDPTR